MKTIFLTGLIPTLEPWLVYDQLAFSGFVPDDVMIVCKQGATESRQAVARFATEEIAAEAVKAMTNRRGGVRAFLSRTELNPPIDPRWKNRWLNWLPHDRKATETQGR